MSLLMFNRSESKKPDPNNPKAPPTDKTDTGKPAQQASEEKTDPPQVDPSNSEIIQEMVATYGMTEDNAKSFLTDFTPIINKLDGSSKDIAKALSKLKYGVAFVTSSGELVVSTSSNKESLKEVINKINEYAEADTEDKDSDIIFSASEDEIEGGEVYELEGKMFVKGKDYLIINKKPFQTVDV